MLPTPGQDGHWARGSALLVRNVDDFLAAVIAAGADVVAQVRFAGRRLNCQRGRIQEIMCPAHVAF